MSKVRYPVNVESDNLTVIGWLDASLGEGFAWHASSLNAMRSAQDFFADQDNVVCYTIDLTSGEIGYEPLATGRRS